MKLEIFLRFPPCLTAWLETATTAELSEIHRKINQIMSAISDFSTKFKAFQDRQNAAVDGLVSDVKTLNDKITELQHTQGEITAEDQALLDAIQSQASAVADKLDALDAATPPPVPPAGEA